VSRARVLPSRSARLPPATCRRHGTAHRAPHRAQVKRGIEAYAAAEAIKHAASAAPRKSDAPAAGDPTHRSGQAAAAAGGRPDRGLKRSAAGVPPLAEKRLREPDADEVQSEDAKQFAKVAAVLQEIGKDRAFVSVMRDSFNKARLLEWLQVGSDTQEEDSAFDSEGEGEEADEYASSRPAIAKDDDKYEIDEAERVEAERVEAERVEAERVEAERVEEARQAEARQARAEPPPGAGRAGAGGGVAGAWAPYHSCADCCTRARLVAHLC
jgi:hypothetical protein